MSKILKYRSLVAHPDGTFLIWVAALPASPESAAHPNGSVVLKLGSLQNEIRQTSFGEIRITPSEALFLRDALNFLTEEGVFDLKDTKPAA